jgi:hypothetical protein
MVYIKDGVSCLDFYVHEVSDLRSACSSRLNYSDED